MKILRTAFAALLWSSLASAQPHVPHVFDYAAGFVTLTATRFPSPSTEIPGSFGVSFASAYITNFGETLVSCTLAVGQAVGKTSDIPVLPGGHFMVPVGDYGGGVHGFDNISCINQDYSDMTSNVIGIAGGTGWDPSYMPRPDIYNPFPDDPFQ